MRIETFAIAFARSGESPGHAVDFQRRARPRALLHGKSWLAREFLCPDFVLPVLLFVKGKGLPRLQFFFRRLFDFVIEVRNEDLAVLVFEFGDDLAKREERIRRRAPIHAGVQIHLRAGGFKFGIDQAAQADVECGQLRGEHFGVRDQREIRL
jgi:hypothetical protein